MSTLLYRANHSVGSKGESGRQKNNQHLILGQLVFNVRTIEHEVSELGIKDLGVSYP